MLSPFRATVINFPRLLTYLLHPSTSVVFCTWTYAARTKLKIECENMEEKISYWNAITLDDECDLCHSKPVRNVCLLESCSYLYCWTTPSSLRCIVEHHFLLRVWETGRKGLDVRQLIFSVLLRLFIDCFLWCTPACSSAVAVEMEPGFPVASGEIYWFAFFIVSNGFLAATSSDPGAVVSRSVE